jgi:transcriptional regulator with XRE-family HTH domain
MAGYLLSVLACVVRLSKSVAMTLDESATATVATRVGELRRDRGWSAQTLGERCAEAGLPGLNRAVLANLESGRRQDVSVEELMVLAMVLDTAPVYLLVPSDKDMRTRLARDWVRGHVALPQQDQRRFEFNKPDED